jgi:hypothetical protein
VTNPQDSGFGRRLPPTPRRGEPQDGANHFDTFTGRWTAPDPLGDAGGDLDWYGYCLDDPVNGVDPLGLFPQALFNMGGQLLQHAPALNRLGVATAQEAMDGRPGIADIFQWYGDTVKDNVRHLKEERRKYYNSRRNNPEL